MLNKFVDGNDEGHVIRAGLGSEAIYAIKGKLKIIQGQLYGRKMEEKKV